MERVLWILLENTLTMSVIAALLLALGPLLAKRYQPRALYLAWLMVAVGLLVPLRWQASKPVLVVKPPRIASAPLQPAESPAPRAALPEMVVTGGAQDAALPQIPTTSPVPLPWADLLFGVWAIGALSVLCVQLWRHGRFLRSVQRWGRPLADPRYGEMLEQERQRLGIRRPVRMLRCPAVDSPMMIGFVRATILLPEETLPTHALAMVLRHELVHLRRGDLWGKALMLLAGAAHWFNPLLPLMARALSFQCEAACDATVMRHNNFRTRQVYSFTILELLRRRNRRQTAFSTSFHSGKRGMKQRLAAILNPRRKRLGVALAALVLVATLSTGLVFALDTAETGETAEPEATAPAGDAILPGATQPASAGSALGTRPVSQTQWDGYNGECNALQTEKGFYSGWSLEERAKLTALKQEYGVVQWYDALDGLPGPEAMPEAEAVALAEAEVLSFTREGDIPYLTRQKLDDLFERRVYYKTYPEASVNPVWWVQYWVKDPADFIVEPYVDGKYVVPGDKTELYAVQITIDAVAREAIGNLLSSNANLEATLEISEIYRVLAQKLGPESDWTLEQRAEFAEIQRTRGDGYVWPDGLPGADDLPLEEACRIAAEAVGREYGLSAGELARFKPYAYFWPDYSVVTEDGDQWRGSMWGIIYRGVEQGDIDTYEDIHVRVYSPSGEVVEVFTTAGSNG